MKAFNIFLTLPALFLCVAYTTSAECTYQDLTSGGTVESTVLYTPEETNYTTFCLQVDEDVFAVRFILSEAEADLDLYINHDEEIISYDDVYISSVDDTYGEEILLTRFSEPFLKTGEYYVDVVYQLHESPGSRTDPKESIPFQIRAEFTRYSIEKEITPDRTVRSLLVPDQGMARTFMVEVPPGKEEMRIDLFDSIGDIDIALGYDDFPRSRNKTSIVAESYLGRESLVLGGSGNVPLEEGRYYITVFDQILTGRPESFSLHVTFSSDPPPFLLHIPAFPVPGQDLAGSILPTVEIISDAGRGSGCIISRKGLILTNWHVIEGMDGKLSKDLYVAVSFSPASPPLELFRAQVVDVDHDRDIALLRIHEGLYGQPLPRSYEFPYFRFSDAAEAVIGDNLYIIGYPAMGGTGSRATITVTRGILSGFEQTYYGTLLKTDGEINTGSSGGACIGEDFKLIGIPTRIIEEDSGQLGYITPVSMVPKAWKHMVFRDN